MEAELTLSQAESILAANALGMYNGSSSDLAKAQMIVDAAQKDSEPTYIDPGSVAFVKPEPTVFSATLWSVFEGVPEPDMNLVFFCQNEDRAKNWVTDWMNPSCKPSHYWVFDGPAKDRLTEENERLKDALEIHKELADFVNNHASVHPNLTETYGNLLMNAGAMYDKTKQ